MKYIIYGDPVAISQNKSESSKTWDNIRKHKIYCSIELENQHDDRPLFEGPISVTANFFIDRKHDSPITQYHTEKPTITALIRFIEAVCIGSLYNTSCIVASLEAKKVYSKQPRTEITVEKI